MHFGTFKNIRKMWRTFHTHYVTIHAYRLVPVSDPALYSYNITDNPQEKTTLGSILYVRIELVK